MKKLILIFLLSTFVFAQESDSTLGKWHPSMVTTFNLSQISFSNWAKGGENSLSWVAGGDFNYNYKGTIWRSKNQLKASYGRSKVGEEIYKTNENDLYLENVISYHLGWAVNPFFSNTVRTQITKGFNYDNNLETEISDFFDPGYITQSIGFTYDKYQNIQTRLGVAFQEVIADKFAALYTDDAETLEIEDFRFETGIESVTDAEVTLDDNLIYKSKLRLFTRFEQLDIWDVRFDNVFTAKVNNWLNVNLSMLLVYQESEIAKTQFRQALQLGIVYTIL